MFPFSLLGHSIITHVFANPMHYIISVLLTVAYKMPGIYFANFVKSMYVVLLDCG